MKKLLTTLPMLAVLSACGTLNLENRVACTVAKDEAVYVSQYGQIGVASKIDAKDTAVLCK